MGCMQGRAWSACREFQAGFDIMGVGVIRKERDTVPKAYFLIY